MRMVVNIVHAIDVGVCVCVYLYVETIVVQSTHTYIKNAHEHSAHLEAIIHSHTQCRAYLEVARFYVVSRCMHDHAYDQPVCICVLYVASYYCAQLYV